jgi:hypothetical protein
MIPTIVASGRTYQIRENDSDLILDSLYDEEMRIIPGGADQNRAEAYSEVATEAKGRAFSTERVKDEANRGLADFAKQHFNESIIVEP